MTYKEALLFVGKCLTLGLHPELISEVQQEIRDGRVVWEQIVQLSSGQFVLPALYIRLQKASLLQELPSDLVEYIEYLTNRNRERNLQILNQIHDIVTLLNSHGIAPIFLKGTAHLLLPLYEDIAERMVGDIDFLVEETEMLKAAQLLIDVGYQPISKFDPKSLSITKHYPRLANYNYPSSVEVHRQVIRPPDDKHFKSSDIIKDKQKIPGPWEVYVPSTEHLIVHNTLNVQVNDKAYLWGTIYLRQMYDLLLLSSRENPQKMLQRFACFPHLSNAYLALTSMVFDSPSGIGYTNNMRIKIHLKRISFFLKYPAFNSAYKSTIYISMRLLRYITLPVQSIYSKDSRAVLWSHISDPRWYKAHVLSYRDHFKPKIRES